MKNPPLRFGQDLLPSKCVLNMVNIKYNQSAEVNDKENNAAFHWCRSECQLKFQPLRE